MAELDDDEDEVSIEARVREYGDVVFTSCWDSNSPGAGADAEWIWRFEDQYWARSSIDGVVGPYTTLKEALAYGAGSVTDATTEIECSELSPEQIFPLLDVMVDETDGPIDVNGEAWTYSGGQWARAIG